MTESTREAGRDWTPDAHTLAAVDRWLAFRVWHSRTPGAQVAIGIGGELAFARAYGYADLETKTPLTNGHLFRIASHSKTFTSTAVLRLVEQGRLGLETPVGEHVVELADDERFASITVRELLEHTAGVLRDGPDSDYWAAQRPFPERAELIELVRAGPKDEPGKLFSYSNLGFSLLGLIIEDVTGASFAEATAELIMTPLGLADTTSEYVAGRASDYAVGYSGLDVGVRRKPIDHVDTHAMAAATGFSSTASDLVAYFTAHCLGDERLLSDRSKRLMQRKINNADPTKPDGPGYGLGMIHERIHDHLLVGHSGGYPGHITKTFVDPTTGLVVSVLTNATDGPATQLATGVVQLLDRAREESERPRPPLSERTLERTGRYANGWGVQELAALGGALLGYSPVGWDPLDSPNQLEVEAGEEERWLIAAGDGYGSVGEPVTFSEDGMRYGGMSMSRFDDLPERPDVLD